MYPNTCLERNIRKTNKILHKCGSMPRRGVEVKAKIYSCPFGRQTNEKRCKLYDGVRQLGYSGAFLRLRTQRDGLSPPAPGLTPPTGVAVGVFLDSASHFEERNRTTQGCFQSWVPLWV